MAVPDIPGDVMAVVACQSCGQWSVLFRGRAVPIQRQILEGGTIEDRQRHLAEIISHFLAAGLFAQELSGFMQGLTGADLSGKDGAAGAAPASNTEPDLSTPISDKECVEFAEIDLPLLDDPQAFRRIFG
jgi:hypothetical protein